MQRVVDVAKSFSKVLGGRHKANFQFSGEEFYDDVMGPMLRVIERIGPNRVVLDLDGVAAVPPSFLAEVCQRAFDEFGPGVEERIGFVSATKKFRATEASRLLSRWSARAWGEVPKG